MTDHTLCRALNCQRKATHQNPPPDPLLWCDQHAQAKDVRLGASELAVAVHTAEREDALRRARSWLAKEEEGDLVLTRSGRDTIGGWPKNGSVLIFEMTQGLVYVLDWLHGSGRWPR